MCNKKLVLIILSLFFLGNASALREMVVAVPVANLRAINGLTGRVSDLSLSDLQDHHKKDNIIYGEAPTIFCRDNPLQCSQFLFGERVIAGAVRADGWVEVQAVEQKISSNGVLKPCPGFIRSNCLAEKVPNYKRCLVVSSLWATLRQRNKEGVRSSKKLSLGSCLSGLYFQQGKWLVDTPIGRGLVSANDIFEVDETLNWEIPALRASVVQTAKKFSGGPYIWGGASAWKEHASEPCDELCDQITGVDCSSLMYLAFKSHGLLIPRNSHSQYLSATPIDSGASMRPGDLIFWSPAQKNLVNHVALYMGDDFILEANGKTPPFGVRTICSSDWVRLGKKRLADCNNGDIINWTLDGASISEVVRFGTFFDAEKLQELRLNFLHAKRGPVSP